MTARTPFAIASTLATSVLLEPFVFPSGEILKLRVEVWKEVDGQYFALLWRRELMRLHPLGGLQQVADCEMDVVDDHANQLCASCGGQTAAECLAAVIHALQHHFFEA